MSGIWCAARWPTAHASSTSTTERLSREGLGSGGWGLRFKVWWKIWPRIAVEELAWRMSMWRIRRRHSYIRTYIHACIHTCIRHDSIHTYTCTHTHTHPRASARAHTHTQRAAHACMHACMHAQRDWIVKPPGLMEPWQHIEDLITASLVESYQYHTHKPPIRHRSQGGREAHSQRTA